MSAPRTNVEKQASNHRFPLAGMAVVLCFVGLITVGIIYVTAERGNTPRDAAHVDDPASTQGTVTAGPETGAQPSDTPATATVAPMPDQTNTPNGDPGANSGSPGTNSAPGNASDNNTTPTVGGSATTGTPPANN